MPDRVNNLQTDIYALQKKLIKQKEDELNKKDLPQEKKDQLQQELQELNDKQNNLLATNKNLSNFSDEILLQHADKLMAKQTSKIRARVLQSVLQLIGQILFYNFKLIVRIIINY